MHRLTSLLKCQACGSTLYRFGNGPRSEPDRAIWRCGGRTCQARASIAESQALAQLAAHLRRMLADVQLPIARSQAPRGETERARKVLESLPDRRARFERAYGDGWLPYEDFTARIEEADAAAERARAILAVDQAQGQQQVDRRANADRLRRILKAVPEFLAEAPKAQVNTLLRELLEAIVVSREGEILGVLPR